MKSIFVRNVYEEERNKYDNNNLKLIRQEVIAERDLNCPPLNPYESIYDKELNKDFKIYKAKRNTDNSYTYVIEEEFEHTIKSLQRELEISKEEYYEENKKIRSYYEEYRVENIKLRSEVGGLEVMNKELETKLNTLKSNIIVKIMIKLGLIS